MLKIVNTSGGSVAANGTIPFTLEYNTNGNTSFSSNTISINRVGYYQVNANFVLTATGTTTNVTLYANGAAIPETSTTITTTSGDNIEITINDIERIVSQSALDKVKLTFVSTTGATLVSANASVVAIK